jgi:tripartite-type tricarboxylate transporter receptor subunit TctC
MVVVRRRLVLAFPLAMTAAGAAARAQAQTPTWPTKQIRFVVPFAAGGNADITARLLGEGLQRRFGQSVIVDNRPGAGGVVGQELVLQAPADGYTLVIGTTGTLYVSPLMAGKPSMLADFTPVSLLSTVPMIVDVPANSRFRSWAELLAAAKAAPGTTSCACRRTRRSPSTSCPIAARASA